MKAGTLQYALGADYRENGFDYTPDNLSDIQNVVDPIAACSRPSTAPAIST